MAELATEGYACNIVLLPEKHLAELAAQTSDTLAANDTLYTIDNSSVFAHLTLYMTQLDSNGIEQAEAILEGISKQIGVFTLNAQGFEQAEGYIDADYTRTAELDSLQDSVVSAINPIRSGMRAKDRARLSQTTGIAHSNLSTYGYRSIGELFRPHVSLTRFRNPPAKINTPLPVVSKFSGRFDALGLFEMGDNGTCVKEIARFALRGSNA